MATAINSLAGKPAPQSALVNVSALIAAYDSNVPDPAMIAQRVSFGTSGPAAGLLAPNHYLSVAIDYLFQHRPQWGQHAAIGKTVVSTGLIDRLAARLGRKLYEVPVGFKWFAAGLHDASLGFSGEESAGATFLRRDGTVWTTDKDGMAAALLSAEIPARQGRDPGALYAELALEFGNPVADRVGAPATAQQRQQLTALTPQQLESTTLAGKKSRACLAKRLATGLRSAASRSSPRGPRAPKESTRSMPRVSAAPNISSASCKRRNALSTKRSLPIASIHPGAPDA